MDVRKELSEYIEKTGIKQAEIARAIGVSSATVSTFMTGNYDPSRSRLKFEEAVKSFLDRMKERTRRPRLDIPFVETTVFKDIYQVLTVAHLDGEIGVICGRAGLGKSLGWKEYSRRNPDVIGIEADLSYNAKDLVREIATACGGSGIGSLNAICEDIIKRLRGSGRMIIIDEAEHLPYRALEILRSIKDKSGIGMAFLGLPRLINNLKGLRGEYEQIYSRVGIMRILEHIKPADTEKIVDKSLPTANGVAKVFHECCGGNARALGKLIRRSRHLAELNGVEVDADIVRTAAKSLII